MIGEAEQLGRDLGIHDDLIHLRRRRTIEEFVNRDYFYMYGDDESVRPQNLAVLTAGPMRTLDMHMHGDGEDTGLRWTPAENVRGVTVEHEADRGDGISRGRIVIKAAME